MKLINLAKKMLLKNAYPQKFIDKCIQKFFNKMFIQIMFRIVREKKFVTSVLRNGTFGEVYTNFISFIPLECKFGLVHTSLTRCFNLSSDFLKFHHEVDKLKKILLKNAYPLTVIDKYIQKFINNMFIQRLQIPAVPKNELTLLNFTVFRQNVSNC